MIRKKARLPLLKKDKNGDIVILFHKNLYRLSVIRDIIGSIEGMHLDTSLKSYFQVKLKTKDPKKGLEICNYLFSEHR